VLAAQENLRVGHVSLRGERSREDQEGQPQEAQDRGEHRQQGLLRAALLQGARPQGREDDGGVRRERGEAARDGPEGQPVAQKEYKRRVAQEAGGVPQRRHHYEEHQ